MSKSVRLGILSALLYGLVKMIIFSMERQHQEIGKLVDYGSLSLLLLIAVFLSIRNSEGGSFLNDLKSGMKTTGSFALIASFISFSYFKWIDTEYVEIKKQERIELCEAEDFDQYKAEHPDVVGKLSREEFREKLISTTEVWLNPNKHFPISLLGLMALGGFYTFFLTFLNRTLLARLK